MYLHVNEFNFMNLFLKDTWSVSLFPYKRSQIVQYISYTKYSNIARLCDK